MLACNETVTFVRHIAERAGDRYECEVVVGVSWYGKRGDQPSTQSGEAPRREYAVRVPASRVPKELPKAGDIRRARYFSRIHGQEELGGTRMVPHIYRRRQPARAAPAAFGGEE